MENQEALAKLLEAFRQAEEDRKAGKFGHSSSVNITFAWHDLPTIIAALEDRARLRAARDSITHVVHVEHGIHTHVSVWVNHAKAGTLVLRTEEFEVFRAALEGRDG